MKKRELLRKTILAGLLPGSFVLIAFLLMSASDYPKRLHRAESYFGIHFDFHANDNSKNVGAQTTPAMIDSIIDMVHPDWIQIDSKGHPGVSSYPTKAGYAAPGLVVDAMPIWREATARKGVSLYVHHSGVADDKAIATHPEWAAIKSDGTPQKRSTSAFSSYVDDRLIPQLKELAAYGIDGVWIDGDCWSAARDFSPAAIAAFQKNTGIQTIPRKPSDPFWFEFLQFNRQAYRNYLNHYVTELKKTNPDFEICSNWAFTDHMPEKVSVPVDYISGDLDPDNSISSARLSARYMALQGNPWDLMSWGFATKPERKLKPAVQLEREAAVVLAMGGGFQAYFTQNGNGSVRVNEMKVMAEVGKFCRARQEFCHRAVPVPQVALLFSTEAHYHKSNGLFLRDFAPMKGNLQALVESQQSVDLVGEHHLRGRMSDYPIIIVPEWEYLDPQFRNELVRYVENGGNLLLIGTKTASLFEKELDIKIDKAQKIDTIINLRHSDKIATFKGMRQSVQLGENARPFGKLYQSNSLLSLSQPAATITKLGKGKIASTCFTMGAAYDKEPNETAKQFLNSLVKVLFQNPVVKVAGSSFVDVCVMRKDNKLMVNLINASGPHHSKSIIESIEPIGPLTVNVRLQRKPTKVSLQPSGQKLDFKYNKGQIVLKVPKIEIHEIIVLEL